MARRRRSLIGGARKASQRVSRDATVEESEVVFDQRSEQGIAPDDDAFGMDSEPPADELITGSDEDSVDASQDLSADDSVDEDDEPIEGALYSEETPVAVFREVERAGMTIVPDADDLDDYMADLDDSYDVIGVAGDGPPPTPEPVSRATPPRQNAADWAADIGVEDADYVETGRFAEDTTDHGWNASVYGAPSTTSSEYDEADDFPRMDTTDLGSGFMDLSDGERPPTEEVRDSMMEDLSHVYDAPMSVPEPPPVPGIVDRYTPPPVSRRAPGGNARPGFSPSLPPSSSHTPPPRREPTPTRPVTPAPVEESRTPVPDLRRREPIASATPPTSISSMGLAFGGGVLAILLLVSLGWLLMNMFGGTDDVPVQPIGPGAVEEPLNGPGLQQGGGLFDRDADADTDAAAPSASPRPAAAAAPAAAAGAAAATVGTLVVESNRDVLVSIDGRPYEFTPLELELAPGPYSISAALPSREDSAQTQRVEIEAGERDELFFRF